MKKNRLALFCLLLLLFLNWKCVHSRIHCRYLCCVPISVCMITILSVYKIESCTTWPVPLNEGDDDDDKNICKMFGDFISKRNGNKPLPCLCVYQDTWNRRELVVGFNLPAPRVDHSEIWCKMASKFDGGRAIWERRSDWLTWFSSQWMSHGRSHYQRKDSQGTDPLGQPLGIWFLGFNIYASVLDDDSLCGNEIYYYVLAAIIRWRLSCVLQADSRRELRPEFVPSLIATAK